MAAQSPTQFNRVNIAFINEIPASDSRSQSISTGMQESLRTYSERVELSVIESIFDDSGNAVPADNWEARARSAIDESDVVIVGWVNDYRWVRTNYPSKPLINLSSVISPKANYELGLGQDHAERVRDTAQLALSLGDRSDSVWIIRGDVSQESRLLAIVKHELSAAGFKDVLVLDTPNDPQALLQEVAKIPQNDSIFYLPITEYQGAHGLGAGEIVEQLKNEAQAPIFSLWYNLVKLGGVAGYAFLPQRAGAEAINAAVDFAALGVFKSHYPVTNLVVNQAELYRHGGYDLRLPPDAEIFNLSLPGMTKQQQLIISTIAISVSVIIAVGAFFLTREKRQLRRLRKFADQLKANRRRLQLVLEGAELGLWDWNPQTDMIRFDQRCRYILSGSDSLAASSLESETSDSSPLEDVTEVDRSLDTYMKLGDWQERLFPEDRQVLVGAMRAHLADESEFFSVDVRVQHASGIWIWVMVKGRINERSKQGEPLKVSGVILDVTALHQATERADLGVRRLEIANDELNTHQVELRAQNDELILTNARLNDAKIRYELMFDASPTALALVNTHLIIEEVNPIFANLAGLSRSELSGCSLDLFVLADLKLSQILSGALKSPALHEWKRSTLRSANGRRIPVRIGLAQVGLPSDLHYLVAVVDITSEVESENRFKEAIETKNRFVANMSHEVRTPLHGIVGNLSLVRDAERLSTDDLKPIDLAIACAEHLTLLINDILDFSRLEAKTFVMSPESTGIYATISRCVDSMRALAQRKGLDLSCELANCENTFVEVDPVRLRQIITNLIGNSIKFTEQGSIRVSCEWHPPQNGLYGILTVKVKDTGVGFDTAEWERLLQPFTQAQQSSQKEYPGTGLGLSIVQQLVKMMAGTFSAESEIGRGSLFKVSLQLPLSASTPQNSGAGDQSDQKASAPPLESAGKKILLVDDSATNLMLGMSMCKKFGVEVVTAINGREAIEKLFQFEDAISLILMDIQMPVLDGVMATEMIRREPSLSDLPIIAVTANVQPEDIRNYRRVGMTDILAKPFKQEQLRSLLERWL
ncbi:MAG TPA: ATP-binding protein [Marinobacterium sp.]|nr:ATP-binding protein [Marinobacterium sp.]